MKSLLSERLEAKDSFVGPNLGSALFMLNLNSESIRTNLLVVTKMTPIRDSKM